VALWPKIRALKLERSSSPAASPSAAKTGRTVGNKEPATPDTANLPPLPEGWTWVSVDQLAAETMIGLDHGRAQQSDDPASGVPYLKLNNVTIDGRVMCDEMAFVPANNEESERFSVKNRDIHFNTRNSKELVGKVGIVRNAPEGAIDNNHLMRIRVPSGIVPEFLCLQMCSHEFRRRKQLVKNVTTNVAAVYQQDLLPLAIAPPRQPSRRGSWRKWNGG